MPKFRTIDPEVWRNSSLRRLSLKARLLFVFLFSSAADDEGRFRIDTLALLEGAFTRGDHVNETHISAMLESLEAEGLMLLYEQEEICYGFLPGWFEHQRIDKRNRTASLLPPPPVPIQSWENADEARAQYSKYAGRENPSFTDAVRWVKAQEQAAQREVRGVHAEYTRQADAECTRQTGRDVTRREGTRGEGSGEGKKKRPLVSAQRAETPPPVDNPKPPPKKETPVQRKARQLQEREDAFTQFTPAEQEEVQRYLDAWADKLDSKAMSSASETNRLLDLLKVRDAVGSKAFLYGVEQALQHSALHPNYVKKAALSEGNHHQRQRSSEEAGPTAAMLQNQAYVEAAEAEAAARTPEEKERIRQAQDEARGVVEKLRAAQAVEEEAEARSP